MKMKNKKKINRQLGFLKTDWNIEYVTSILEENFANTVYVKIKDYHYEPLQLSNYKEVLKDVENPVFYSCVGINTKTFEVEIIEQNGGLGLFGTAYENQFVSNFELFKQYLYGYYVWYLNKIKNIFNFKISQL